MIITAIGTIIVSWTKDEYRRRETVEYRKKRLEESFEEDRDLIDQPDLARLLATKHGFEDDRLVDDILDSEACIIPGGDDFELLELKFYESGPCPFWRQRLHHSTTLTASFFWIFDIAPQS